MKFFFLLICSSCCLLSFTHGQLVGQSSKKVSSSQPPYPTPAEIQIRLKESIRKITPACVQVVTHEPLGGSPTGMGASGVCISADGLIMTAGHMVIPHGNYEIIFPDGKKVTATGLGKIGKLDAGLIKITQQGTYPFALLGYSSLLQKGDLCFSISYPGSFRNRQVARMGYIEKIATDLTGDVRTNYLLTTCPMEPGDSGGPLFDIDGQVIGTRSYIGQALNENYEAPVDVFRRYWSALHQPVNYLTLPEEDENALTNGERKNPEFTWSQLTNPLHEEEKELNNYVVKILSGTNQIMGTLINPKEWLSQSRKKTNAIYIISKNSEIGSSPKIIFQNKEIPATVLFRNPQSDLVLLEANGNSNWGLTAADIETAPLHEYAIGNILLSVLPSQNSKISLVGTPSFELSGYYYTGFLGLRLEAKGAVNFIASVQPNSPADKAGMKTGDIINTINQVPITEPSTLISQLQNKKPGDTVTIIRTRNSRMDTLSIILEQRPFQGINHISEQFPGGRSERRDGFNEVFIHSADLTPQECGGPVFDLSGKFVGINIARYSRIGTLVIPANEVLNFLKNQIR